MPPTATNNNSNNNNDKHTKLKRSIVVGVIISFGILGWHFYEYFLHQKPDTDSETPSEHEIFEFTQKLFADEVKHNPYLERINFQGKTKPYRRDDQAAQPLLQLRDDVVAADTTSTVFLLKRLYDNYELDTNIVEHVTPEEAQEELDFLHAILKTPIMKRTMKFLQLKGVASADNDAQLRLLQDIWFTQYSRGHGRIGSSGFEHVFLAELKGHNLLGLHNWIYFHEQEKQGHLNYKGYIDRIDFGKDDQHLLATRFTFHDIAKPYKTLMVGTSPELELSLYTVCFLLSPAQPCPVQFGATKFSIITHAWDWRGKKTLASAYPSIE